MHEKRGIIEEGRTPPEKKEDKCCHKQKCDKYASNVVNDELEDCFQKRAADVVEKGAEWNHFFVFA